jgi:hypothetical protein
MTFIPPTTSLTHKNGLRFYHKHLPIVQILNIIV